MMKKVTFLFVFLPFFLYGSPSFYLTFPGDPAKSMAIHWIEERDPAPKTVLLYRKNGEYEWTESLPLQERFQGILLQKVILDGLDPDTEYSFSIGMDSPVHRFRTLQEEGDRPLRIAVGGDAYEKRSTYREMNKIVAAMSPDFVILGGDLAYANKGNPKKRWERFFRIWSDTMRTDEGRIIPLSAAVGNHELFGRDQEGAEMFLQFFPYLDRGSYGSLKIGNRVLFLILDTGHIRPVEGAQADWIGRILQEEQTVPWKFAVYHVAAYPSIYPYEGKISSAVRKYWCPSFEENGLLAAFENHNHAFKRTYPIAREKIDPEGVVYIGDGAWSASYRNKKNRRWYLETVKGENCFSLLTINNSEAVVESFDNRGKKIDCWKTGTKVPVAKN